MSVLLRWSCSYVCGATILRYILYAAAVATASAAWPNGPMSVSGRSIVDASDATVMLAGVNLPGHSEVMIPEGLQYQSVSTIVTRIKSLGMNAVRLTYAIEMIDQISDNGGEDIQLRTALINALGANNGTAVFNRIIANNPSFGSSTTRLQVFDAVAAECARQQIYVHLDNHLSKAMWCCNPFDGNSWWGDQYFSASNWTRGLSYMANHGKNWPALISMSLRNELRQPLTGAPDYSVNKTYSWDTWYQNSMSGVAAIRSANPDLLVFVSGMDSDTDLGVVAGSSTLSPSKTPFNATEFMSGAVNKMVLELHNYDFSFAIGNCSHHRDRMVQTGWGPPDPYPVVMTELGYEQNGKDYQKLYATCMKDLLSMTPASGWMVWALSGSYYIRQGRQDDDENWGLTTHDWSTWRDQANVNDWLRPLVNNTLAAAQNSTSSGAGGNGGSSGNGTSANGATSLVRKGTVTQLLPKYVLSMVGMMVMCLG